MKIQTLNYHQHTGKPTAWAFQDFVLNPRINLIVGKNASGKTKIFNLLGNLALILSGLKRDLFSSGNWDLTFHTDKGKEVRYQLGIERHAVSKEELSIDGETLLQRKADGKGSIHYVSVGQNLEFQIAKQELAAVQKRDSIQHPYLELLYDWADAVLSYPFATDMGRRSLHIELGSTDATEAVTQAEDDKRFIKSPINMIEVYQRGKELKGFEHQVQADMKSIGYDLQFIKVEPMTDVTVRLHNIPIGNKQAQCLFIKERGIAAKIPQQELSQGMFRALSLIIHLNYVERSETHHPTCILIDDIGEGLDFERSTKLIQLLVDKVESGRTEDVQLIMTSNDRFVMNKVPLAYWTIIERSHQGLRFYNEGNSPEVFKEFELAGLNNFDMFSSDFYKGQG